MTAQWGAPLTGAQMKALRAAGLPDGTNTNHHGWEFFVEELTLGDKEYRLPSDHAAYTLANAGWLDGRNVALWFGGDKAPDDWDGNHVMFRNGGTFTLSENASSCTYIWGHIGVGSDIIAYTRKAACDHTGPKVFISRSHEGNVACGDCQEFLDAPPQLETVTIAKMTPSEVKAKFNRGVQPLVVLNCLGLIKPEPTRLERFWATRDTKDVYGPPSKAFQLIEEALNFEK